MRPICVPCQREMKANKTGRVLQLVSDGKPYQLWSSDEWRCEELRGDDAAGYGRGPMVSAEIDPVGYERLLRYEDTHTNVVTISV